MMRRKHKLRPFLAVLLTVGLLPVAEFWQSQASAAKTEGLGTPATYQTVFSLYSCDRLTEVGLSPAGTLDTADKMEGKSSLVMGGGQNAPSIWLTETQLEGSTDGVIDLGASTEELAVAFWMKTTDRTKVANLYVQLSSDNAATNTLTWIVDSTVIPENDAWTYVLLPLRDAAEAGTVNRRAINYFRAMFLSDTTGATFQYDDFSIVSLRRPDTFTVASPTSESIWDIGYADNPSGLEHWDAGSRKTVTLDEEEFTEGYASFRMTAGTGLQVLQITPGVMDTVSFYACSEAYLCFDLYVSDAALVSPGMQAQLCYTEGAFSDTDNITYWLKQIHTGWNRYVLPLDASGSKAYADIVKNGNGPNRDGEAAANFFRILLTTTGNCTVRLDGVKITGRYPANHFVQPVLTQRTTSLNGYQKVVTVCSVADFGADGTDAYDDTPSFRRAIEYAGSLGGGTIWVPAGRYVLREALALPENVALLGEWSDPDTPGTDLGQGSVLLVKTGHGSENGTPFLTLGGASCAIGLTIVYPFQNAATPVPYPVTIQAESSQEGNYGFSTVRYCTLVNPYVGIRFGPAANELGVIEHVYMTPLKQGILVQYTTDVGRIRDIHIASEYYTRYDASVSGTVLKDYMKAAVVGMEFQRSDWQQLSDYTARDVHTGVLIRKQEVMTAALVDSANVVMSDIRMSNVVTGIDIASGRSSQILTKPDITADEACIRVGAGFSAAVSVNGGILTSPSGSGIVVEAGSTGMLSVMDLTFGGWGDYAVDASGGALVVQGCQGGGTGTAVRLAQGTQSASLDKNRNLSVEAHSSVDAYTGSNTYAAKTDAEILPDYGICPQAAGSALLNGLDYGADKTGAEDSTTAVQNALNAASAAGGGIVYLPAGLYWVGSPLQIPTGVELRGVAESGHHTNNLGTVLMSTNGQGNPSAAAFITLQSGAGIRGLTIWYPNQNKWNTPAAFPSTIRGAGQNVWVVNVTVAGGTQGVDLSADAGGHYLEFYCGFSFQNNITVDNASAAGRLINLHFNPHFYMRSSRLSGHGGWAAADESAHIADLLSVMHSTLDGAVILKKTTGEQVISVFNYGGRTGLKLLNGSAGAFDGVLFSAGFDGSVTAYQVEETAGSALFLNTSADCVPSTAGEESYYLKQSGGTVRLVNNSLSSYNWTLQNGAVVEAGTLELRQVMFSASATNATVQVKGGSSVKATLDGCLFLHKGAGNPDGVSFSNQSSGQVVDLKKPLLGASVTLGCNVARNFWSMSRVTRPSSCKTQTFTGNQ